MVLTIFHEVQVKNAQATVKDLKAGLQASLQNIVDLDERFNALQENASPPSNHTFNTEGPSTEVGVEEGKASMTNGTGEQRVENGVGKQCVENNVGEQRVENGPVTSEGDGVQKGMELTNRGQVLRWLT